MLIKITIREGEDDETHIIAETEDEAKNPRMYLESAINSLQWQLDNYLKCPIHQRVR